MNGTGGLLRKSAEFLLRNPIVLVPVLVARVLDFAFYWLCGVAKEPAMKAVAPRSVLGGFSGKINAPVLVAAVFFTFLPLLCEIALLVYSMAVSGRWAHAIRNEENAGERSWSVPAAEVGRVALLTLVVGAVTAGVGLYFTLRGGVPVRWTYLVTWCFLITSLWFILPSWLGLLAHVQGVRKRDTSRVPPFTAASLGFAVYAALIYAGLAMERSLFSAHRAHAAGEAFGINLLAALLSAIPLCFAFVAMSRYVADRPGWNSE